MGIRAGGAKPRKDFPMLADLYMRGKLKLDEMISNTDSVKDYWSSNRNYFVN